MLGVWEGIPGTNIRQAMAEKILLQNALFERKKKTAENAEKQTMMVDKDNHVTTKIYPSDGDFCRRFSLLFLGEFRRRIGGDGSQYFIRCNGVLELPIFGEK